MGNRLETGRLPCRIVVYADLPIGVPFGFYSKTRVKLEGMSMRCSFLLGLAIVSLSDPVFAQSIFAAPPEPVEDAPVVVAQSQPPMQGNFGGGFIEFLFGDFEPAVPAKIAAMVRAAAGTELLSP